MAISIVTDARKSFNLKPLPIEMREVLGIDEKKELTTPKKERILCERKLNENMDGLKTDRIICDSVFAGNSFELKYITMKNRGKNENSSRNMSNIK